MKIIILLTALLYTMRVFSSVSYERFLREIDYCMDEIEGDGSGRCSSRRYRRITREILDNGEGGYNCAGTATYIRRLYYTAANEQIPGGFPRPNHLRARHFASDIISRDRVVSRFRPISLSQVHTDQSSFFVGVRAGDMLQFDNVHCQNAHRAISGHLMTVVGVNYDSEGRPESVRVLEGHTGRVRPTHRTLMINELIENANGLHGEDGGISDLNCTEFRGISRWVPTNTELSYRNINLGILPHSREREDGHIVSHSRDNNRGGTLSPVFSNQSESFALGN